MSERTSKWAVSGAEGVRIEAARGEIRIVAPEHWSAQGEAFLLDLLSRIGQCAHVTQIDVARATQQIAVRYDRGAASLDVVLRDLAAAIASPSASQHVSRLSDGLRQIPGRIVRIERPAVAGSLWRTIRRQGAAFWTRWRSIDERGSVRGAEREFNQTVCKREFAGYRVAYLPNSDAAPQALSAISLPAGELVPAKPRVAQLTGLKRLVFLAGGGVCFVMSIVGLITPGIPTVPFVLATSYFLMRSSPSLNQKFRNSRLFGQMARDWEDRGGLRWSTKCNAVLATGVLMGITLLIAGISIPVLAVMGVMGTLGLYLIFRLPTIPEDAPDDRRPLLIPA